MNTTIKNPSVGTTGHKQALVDAHLTEEAKFKLLLMSKIQHPEGYYQNAISNLGIDFSKLTHTEISIWVAEVKKVEVEAMIYVVNNIYCISNERFEDAIDKMNRLAMERL